MNYEQITGILRAVVPAVLAYCVGKGWISQNDVGEISAAVVAVGAAAWSVINNKTGVVNGTGGKLVGVTPGGAIGSAIVVGFFLMYGGSAHAQTVSQKAVFVTKAPVVAVVPAPTGCQQLSCTGLFAGAVIYGIGGNAAILQNGLNNSVFAGGGDFGFNIGGQYWDGKYYVGVDTELMLESQNKTGVTSFAGASGGFVGVVHFKLGGNLVALVANGPSPIAVPALASSFMASYIDNCSAFRKGGTQYCAGAGQEFWLAKNLTLDVLYDYGAPTKNFNALQNVGAKVAYHF